MMEARKAGGREGGRSEGWSGRWADRPTVGPSDRLPAGATLFELLVVLVLLGVMAGLGAVSVVSLRPTTESARLDTLRAARSRAIRIGEAVMLTLDSVSMRFLPDGRVIGGPLDPLTGAWPDAR